MEICSINSHPPFPDFPEFFFRIFRFSRRQRRFGRRRAGFCAGNETIRIPGHPHAFNPSIIRWRGQLLMSFRDISKNYPLSAKLFNSSGFFNCCGSSIGLVRLDDDFNPIGKVGILDLKNTLLHSRSEDARLFTIHDRLYIAYSDNRDELFSDGGFRMYIAQLDFDGVDFFLHPLECLSQFEGENTNRREKNWVPFDYNGDLLRPTAFFRTASFAPF